jgi:iron complex transport system substrate-binding protein
MKSLTWFITLLAIAVALSCRTAEVPRAEVTTREVRDDLGRTVRVPEKIDRVISLAPSLTEMIFAAGAGDKLVGVTTYCNYPPEAAAIEKIGDTQTPNIERIIALKPQVVFVSTASQLEAFMQTLNEQAIAVYVTNPKSLDEILGNIRQLGEILGTSKQADDAATALTMRADSVLKKAKYDGDPSAAANRDRPRVFVQISNDPLFTIGTDSFLTKLVEQAGGVSVTKDVPSGYPKLSKETAAALDPDIIFLSDSEDNREPNAAFKNSKAVRNGHVYRINADIISRPGPRLVDALEEIASKLKEKN